MNIETRIEEINRLADAVCEARTAARVAEARRELHTSMAEAAERDVRRATAAHQATRDQDFKKLEKLYTELRDVKRGEIAARKRDVKRADSFTRPDAEMALEEAQSRWAHEMVVARAKCDELRKELKAQCRLKCALEKKRARDLRSEVKRLSGVATAAQKRATRVMKKHEAWETKYLKMVLKAEFDALCKKTAVAEMEQ